MRPLAVLVAYLMVIHSALLNYISFSFCFTAVSEIGVITALTGLLS